MRILMAILGASLLMVGCVATVPPPPPPRVVVVPARPYAGAVWVQGHWKWSRWRHNYVWVPGHWRRARVY